MKFFSCTTPRMTVFAALATGLGLAQAQSLPPPPVSPAPVVSLEYDAQGNPTRRVLAPGVANHTSSTGYDRLSRPVLDTDARGKLTQRVYDGRENLLQLTDPRGLVTQYPRTGLGDTTGLISPDTGTATHTLDTAGNVRTRTDSRGVTATFSYDALNRLTSAVHTQGGQSQSFVWAYDQTGPGFSNGIGRLTSTQFPGGATTYAYDAQGRLSLTTQTVAAATTVTLAAGYAHDAAGHLTRMTYPSGRVLYIPHVGGQPAGLSIAPSEGRAALPLISGLQFEPNPGGDGGPGALRSWNWELNSGSMAHARVFDLYGRMVRYPLGGAVRDISYDAADRVASFTHLDALSGQATAAAQALNQLFGYDELGRLTRVSTPTGAWAYDYDDNGNRTLLSYSSGSVAVNRPYTVDPASNRLLAVDSPARSFNYDAAGNLTGTVEAGYGWTVTVGPSGRIQAMQSVAPAGGAARTTQYVYNAFGQRTVKIGSNMGPGVLTTDPFTPVNCLIAAGYWGDCEVPLPAGSGTGSPPPQSAPTSSTVYMYSPQGELLGEYDGATGAVVREYDWLHGLPVAVVDGSLASPQVYYVQADHIDTPRVLLDRAGRQRWSWVAEPFGHSAPVEDPIGLGAVKLNLRMPGQYFDEESGLSYNWHRSYDAAVGRYTQSDPIGLAGGINTYLYANAAPTMYTDPDGKFAIPLIYWAPPVIAGAWWWLTRPPAPMERTPPRWWPSMPEGDAEFCRQERRRCAELCEEAECKPDFQNIWGGSIDRCIRGCLPEKCGGNKTGR